MSIVQRFSKREFVDQAATRAVDDANTAFCLLQTRNIKNVARLRGERRMQRNEIRAREQIVEIVHEFNLQAASA